MSEDRKQSDFIEVAQGEFLKASITACGFNVVRFAGVIGVKPDTIYNATTESRIGQITSNLAIKLADYFGETKEFWFSSPIKISRAHPWAATRCVTYPTIKPESVKLDAVENSQEWPTIGSNAIAAHIVALRLANTLLIDNEIISAALGTKFEVTSPAVQKAIKQCARAVVRAATRQPS